MIVISILKGGIFVNLTRTGAFYMSFVIMVFDWLVKIVAIYTMYMATKAFKIYIKKNS